MNKYILSVFLIILIGVVGCTTVDVDNSQNNEEPYLDNNEDFENYQEVIQEEINNDELNISDEEEMIELSVLNNYELLFNEGDFNLLGLNFKEECNTEEYETSESSPLEQYSICQYTFEESEIVLEIKKYTNIHDLEGTYQYNSLHLRSSDGILSEDEYGDKSRFIVNSENDYGAEFNEPGVFYYNFWITKELYLIHITSKGVEEDKYIVLKIGEQILSKFA
jgi:hypothetical protein